MGNADFSWFTDLKGDTSKYYSGFAITIPSHVFEAVSLHMITSAKDKPASTYTDSKHAFEVAHNFGMLWKQHGFLISSRNKNRDGPYFQELIDAILFTSVLK